MVILDIKPRSSRKNLSEKSWALAADGNEKYLKLGQNYFNANRPFSFERGFFIYLKGKIFFPIGNNGQTVLNMLYYIPKLMPPEQSIREYSRYCSI
jgi:hypothetical protein